MEIHQAWKTPKLKLAIIKVVTTDEHNPVPIMNDSFLLFTQKFIIFIHNILNVIIPNKPNSSQISKKLLCGWRGI